MCGHPALHVLCIQSPACRDVWLSSLSRINSVIPLGPRTFDCPAFSFSHGASSRSCPQSQARSIGCLVRSPRGLASCAYFHRWTPHGTRTSSTLFCRLMWCSRITWDSWPRNASIRWLAPQAARRQILCDRLSRNSLSLFPSSHSGVPDHGSCQVPSRLSSI